MKAMGSEGREGERRAAIIARMNRIVQRDAPWVFGFHPKTYVLSHAWVQSRKPSAVGRNTLKYQRLDPVLREQQRQAPQQRDRPVLHLVVERGTQLEPRLDQKGDGVYRCAGCAAPRCWVGWRRCWPSRSRWR